MFVGDMLKAAKAFDKAEEPKSESQTLLSIPSLPKRALMNFAADGTAFLPHPLLF